MFALTKIIVALTIATCIYTVAAKDKKPEKVVDKNNYIQLDYQNLFRDGLITKGEKVLLKYSQRGSFYPLNRSSKIDFRSRCEGFKITQKKGVWTLSRKTGKRWVKCKDLGADESEFNLHDRVNRRPNEMLPKQSRQSEASPALAQAKFREPRGKTDYNKNNYLGLDFNVNSDLLRGVFTKSEKRLLRNDAFHPLNGTSKTDYRCGDFKLTKKKGVWTLSRKTGNKWRKIKDMGAMDSHNQRVTTYISKRWGGARLISKYH